MKPDIVYRPFEPQDFDVVADITAKQWYSYLPQEQERIVAEGDVCEHLGHSSYAVSALVNDVLGGVCFVYYNHQYPYEKKTSAALEDLESRYADVVDVRKNLFILDHEFAQMEAVTEERGDNKTGRLELLLISPSMRGHGLGKGLLERGLRWLRAEGACSFRLSTDEDCDYSFWEHKGMKRVSDWSLPWDEIGIRRDFHTYVYEGSIG